MRAVDILINGVGRSGIPVRALVRLMGRQKSYSSIVTVQIPGYAYTDMGVEPQGLILRKYADSIHS